MRISRRYHLQILTLTLLGLCACRESAPMPPGPAGMDGLDLATSDLAAADMTTVRHDMAVAHGDMSLPSPNPPPTSCDERYTGYTAIQAIIRIDKYKGLYTGGTGTHEDADATLINTIWVYNAAAIDTTNISLAMLVNGTAGAGLPMEIPLAVGQEFEIEGEYIPKSIASASTDKGPAAVIHFSHTPCGYVVLNGTTYH